MGKYNFDEIIDRRGTSCNKWEYNIPEDVIPMWVADMDFAAAPEIREAMQKRLDHPVYGYTHHSKELKDAIVSWVGRRYHWDIQSEWLGFSPGVVPALVMSLLSLTTPGDRIVIMTPVYHPFYSSIEENGRVIINHQLDCDENGRYSINFERLEAQIDNRCKAIMMCNPHNPVGRVFTGKELEELFAFAARHDIVVVADEIHSDLILEGEHIPAITLNEAARQRVILHHSASKTYNIPGLPVAFAIIPNEKLRHKYEEVAATMHAPFDTLSFVALEAAFTKGEEWRQELLEYLRENKKWLDERISRIPGLSICHSEGTYLGWIDARETGLSDPAGFFMKEAGVKFNDGESFSAPGFIRVNFACPRAYLEEAFDKVEKALDNWKKQEKVY